ncbi:MAG: hypothetical protein AB8F94_24420 [Saprospiraceae bacterium]
MRNNNSREFTKKIWWLTILINLILSTIFFFTEQHENIFGEIFLPSIYLPFFLFITIIGLFPTYIFFTYIVDFLYVKSISDLILRVEILIWIIPFFTFNIFILDWLISGITNENLFSSFLLFYICLFCFILTSKIERKREFVKTAARDDILDDDLDFKK